MCICTFVKSNESQNISEAKKKPLNALLSEKLYKIKYILDKGSKVNVKYIPFSLAIMGNSHAHNKLLFSIVTRHK